MSDASSDFASLPEPKVDYASETASILDEFYNPFLAHSVRYDRISGYFSSAVYLLTWEAMAEFFLKNEGRMRLICSPRLLPRDAEAVRSGESSDAVSEHLREELRDLLTDKETQRPTQLLACLVANGRLEVRVATWSEAADHFDQAMFHDKVGIFIDARDEVVVFRGSLNETFLAMSPKGNAESISVFPSWVGGRDAERSLDAVGRFDRLFSNEAPGIHVRRLPEDVEADLVELGGEISLEDALRQVAEVTASEPRIDPGTRPPLRPHQAEALDEWRNNGYRGIFEHATGAGKTRSGLEASRASIESGLTPVVIVPTLELLAQWEDAAAKLLDVKIELCGGGHSGWAKNGRLETLLWYQDPRLIIALLPTASSDKFSGILSRNGDRLALIVDEVHRIGSPRNRIFLNRVDARRRLGLSATPERFGDPEGTLAIIEYFGEVVHRYSLSDGIRDGYLVPYSYYPRIVSLTESEQADYDELTKKISKAMAVGRGDEDSNRYLESLIQKRARIAKRASNKTGEIVAAIQESYQEGQRWLVYCADIEHLNETAEALEAAGYAPVRYHSQMEGDRRATRRRFELNGGIIVAVKCLDEGVDIPNATHALIASSSQNRREFIQRRGRVLRVGPDKTQADVIDILVKPLTITNDKTPRLVESEIARAAEFAEWALNRAKARDVLLGVLQEYNLAASAALINEGFEDNDD